MTSGAGSVVAKDCLNLISQEKARLLASLKEVAGTHSRSKAQTALRNQVSKECEYTYGSEKCINTFHLLI